jgi:hypothetical protein
MGFFQMILPELVERIAEFLFQDLDGLDTLITWTQTCHIMHDILTDQGLTTRWWNSTFDPHLEPCLKDLIKRKRALFLVQSGQSGSRIRETLRDLFVQDQGRNRRLVQSLNCDLKLYEIDPELLIWIAMNQGTLENVNLFQNARFGLPKT